MQSPTQNLGATFLNQSKIMNPVTCWNCGVWCCDLGKGNKNSQRNKTQNDKIAEVYPLLGFGVVVGSSF